MSHQSAAVQDSAAGAGAGAGAGAADHEARRHAGSTASATATARAPAAAAPAVSIVIPTYRRPDMLLRCLRAAAAQRFDRPYEIVVADDGPDPDTRAAVERFAGQAAARGGPRVRYVPNDGPRHGPAAARNRGWRAAAAPLVAFTDDDTVPEADWIARGLAACADGVDAAWGHVVMPIPPVPTDYEKDAKGLEGAEFVTANCFVRRAALAAVGGFDERFPFAWREDSDLLFSLLSRGMRVVPARDAIVLHPVRPAKWGVSVSQQKKAQVDALLYKKHPELYRGRIPGTPWRYYAIVGALAVAAGGAVAGSPRVATTAAAGWALLTLRFAAERLRDTSKAPSHVAEMLVTSAAIPPLSVFWRLRGALKYRVVFA